MTQVRYIQAGDIIHEQAQAGWPDKPVTTARTCWVVASVDNTGGQVLLRLVHDTDKAWLLLEPTHDVERLARADKESVPVSTRRAQALAGPLRLDYTPISAKAYDTWRKALLLAPDEQQGARYPYPSHTAMAKRLGCADSTSARWARDGIGDTSQGAWVAVIRLLMTGRWGFEQVPKEPLQWSAMARLRHLCERQGGSWVTMIGLHEHTLGKWRKSGEIPTQYGCAALVAYCLQALERMR